MRPPIRSVPGLISRMLGRRANIGRVERMEGRRIIGWAADPRNPGMPVQVTLAVDGTHRAVVRADKPRADVAAAGAGPELCGFEVILPDDLPDNAPHRMSILLPDGSALPGLSLSIDALPASEGHAGQVWPSDATGPPITPQETASPSSGHNPGSRSIWSAIAKDQSVRSRSDLPSSANELGPAGLVHPSDVGGNLSSASRTPSIGEDSSLLGFADRIGPSEVTGWLVDTSNPDRMMDVCLLVDGFAVLTASADQERRDVVASGQTRLNCGFRFPLPEIVFDGRPHIIEVTEVVTGRVLRNGRAEITIPFEGLAFLNADACAISGWIRPASSVSVRFDDGEVIPHRADLPVGGLGTLTSGFEIAIPSAFIDGMWHKAEILYPGSHLPLDNSPISFRLDPAWRPVARNARLVARRFQVEITDPSGNPVSAKVEIEIDKAPFDAHRSFARVPSGERRPVETLSFALPPKVRNIALFHTGPDDKRTPLGHWHVDADGLHIAEASDLGEEISPRTLDNPALREGAAAAHAAFCDPRRQNDPLFDPRWYGLTYLGQDDLDRQAALAHYAAEGAAEGHAPSPLFDEEGARILHPALAAAIKAGQFPSALSLYLHLGRGLSLHPLAGVDLATLLRDGAMTDLPTDGLHHLTPDLAERTAHLPDAPLPPPTWQMHASQSVYAAWMDRLDIDDTQREALQADEQAARDFVADTRLHRRPLVSIIMPTFNRAHTIGDAIQSALDQTYPDFELLICDDASQDKTSEVIKQFDDPRIRYMQFSKSNGAETRNKGLRYARGQYLAYLDSDNLWHPLFLDMMIRRLLDAPGTSIAYGAYLDTETIGAGVELAALSRPAFRPVMLSHKNFMDLNTIVHHRRIYDWLEGFDPTLPRLQDWDLMLRYTSVFRPVFVDHALVYYRRNVAWGQVTNLFMNSGAQDFVRRKTQKRLEEAHVHLAIDWPARPRATVIAADGPGPAILACNIAALAAPFADIDLFADAADAAPLPEGITLCGPSTGMDQVSRHLSLQGDGALTICVGLSDADCTALQDMVPTAQVFTLDHAADGIGLRLISDPRHRHHLGTVPFHGRDTSAAPRPMTVLFPTQADRQRHSDIAKSARAGGMALMIPPEGMEKGDWLLFPETGTAPARLSFAEGLAQAVRGVIAVAAAMPVEDMTGAEFALFTTLQGRGVPLAVVSSPHGDDLLDSRSAYHVARPTPAWIAEKLAKLMQGADGEIFAAAALKAWRINQHPELVQERLASFIHAVEYERVAAEVSHVAD